MFLRTKNSMERLKFYRIFSKINKSWYELFDRCFTSQKFDGTLKFCCTFRKRQKLIWVRLSTKFCLTFWNWLSWYQLFGKRTNSIRTKKIWWNFKVLMYFSKSTKVDMRYEPKNSKQKIDGTLKFWRTFMDSEMLQKCLRDCKYT